MKNHSIPARGSKQGSQGASEDPHKLPAPLPSQTLTELWLELARVPSGLPNYRPCCRNIDACTPNPHPSTLSNCMECSTDSVLILWLVACRQFLYCQNSEICVVTVAGCYLLNLQNFGEAGGLINCLLWFPRRRGLVGVLVLYYRLEAKTEPFRCNISWKRRDDKRVKAPSPRGGPFQCRQSNLLCHNPSRSTYHRQILRSYGFTAGAHRISVLKKVRLRHFLLCLISFIPF
jgi:hypothetical protein